MKISRHPDKLTFRDGLDVVVFHRPGAKDWAVQITPHVDDDALALNLHAEPVYFAGGFTSFDEANVDANAFRMRP